MKQLIKINERNQEYLNPIYSIYSTLKKLPMRGYFEYIEDHISENEMKMLERRGIDANCKVYLALGRIESYLSCHCYKFPKEIK